MNTKTYIKPSNQPYNEFLMHAFERVEKELPVDKLHVVDCPLVASDDVMNKFHCPVQLSLLDELTFHTV